MADQKKSIILKVDNGKIGSTGTDLGGSNG